MKERHSKRVNDFLLIHPSSSALIPNSKPPEPVRFKRLFVAGKCAREC
jgi:hypothetical protein